MLDQNSKAPLSSARNEGIIVLHEVRHDCANGGHPLLVRITNRGIELVCPMCRTNDKDNARLFITPDQLILYLLMIMRAKTD